GGPPGRARAAPRRGAGPARPVPRRAPATAARPTWFDGRRRPPQRGGPMDRLSPLDASFLHVEDDVNHMHIGAIGIFAGPPPGIDEFRRTLAGRLHRVPRYHQRVRTVPLG